MGIKIKDVLYDFLHDPLPLIAGLLIVGILACLTVAGFLMLGCASTSITPASATAERTTTTEWTAEIGAAKGSK